MGCYSFHETKNYSMGEGGALLIKDADMIESAEIISPFNSFARPIDTFVFPTAVGPVKIINGFFIILLYNSFEFFL